MLVTFTGYTKKRGVSRNLSFNVAAKMPNKLKSKKKSQITVIRPTSGSHGPPQTEFEHLVDPAQGPGNARKPDHPDFQEFGTFGHQKAVNNDKDQDLASDISVEKYRFTPTMDTFPPNKMVKKTVDVPDDEPDNLSLKNWPDWLPFPLTGPFASLANSQVDGPGDPESLDGESEKDPDQDEKMNDDVDSAKMEAKNLTESEIEALLNGEPPHEEEIRMDDTENGSPGTSPGSKGRKEIEPVEDRIGEAGGEQLPPPLPPVFTRRRR